MEHKKKIWLKGILVVALFVMVFITYLSPVSAQINEDYISGTGITQAAVDAVTSDNPLLSPIAKFVYFIGATIEWILSSLSSAATGMNTMPWADMILYNSVALLDVNFLNPNDASLLGSAGMQQIIQKVYYTVFSLAIAFFGVAIVVMAIKLAISSIAEEKAKYKSAITNWVVALVLLFTIHYFMSFVFYLNESVVKMASDMCVNLVSENMQELAELQESQVVDSYINSLVNAYNAGKLDNYEDSINSMILSIGRGTLTKTEDKKLEYDPSNIRPGLNNYNENEAKTMKLLFGNQNSEFNKWLYNRDNSFLWYTQDASEVTDATLAAVISFANEVHYIADTDHQAESKEIVDAYKTYKKNSSKANKDDFIDKLAPRFAMISKNRVHNLWDQWGGQYEETADEVKNKAKSDSNYFNKLEEVMNYVMSAIDYNTNKENKETVKRIGDESPVSLIASYFKNSAFNLRDNTIISSDANVTFCFLYTIFVFQSLLYFFAYVKRFFYIIILSIMAPIVIVYNFVSKI